MPDTTPQGRNDQHQFNYSKIADNLYLGSDFCQAGVCLLHAAEFAKLGIFVEINLSKEENELPPTNLESYVWLPVPDGGVPTTDQFDIGTSVINEALVNSRAVYVHCRNGHGRSPTLIAAYFIRYQGKSVDEAVAFTQGQRNEIHVEFPQREALQKYWEKLTKNG